VPLTAINLKGLCGIYAWIHRASGMCYVGSALDIGRRIGGHLRDSRGTKSTTLHHRALRAFGADEFDVELLEECAASALPEREAFYIALLDAASINGFNTHTKPGHGARGSKLNEATKLRLSEGAKGRKFSPLALQRSLESRRTPEGRENIAAAKRGTKRSPEAIEKHRAKMLGHDVSEETRRLISEANKGTKPSQSAIDASVRILMALPKGENKKRLKDGFKGKHHTEESKRKIGEKAKARAARKRAALMAEQLPAGFGAVEPPEGFVTLPPPTADLSGLDLTALMPCEI
jgi:group I intron endonuclease